MHLPYKVSLLKKLSGIETIKAFQDQRTGKDYVLVGTKQGHLLMLEDTQDSDRADIHSTNKKFSQKEIKKLDVIPDYNILVALKDSVVSVHDILANFPLIATLPGTKGASSFALDIKRERSLTGELGVFVRLAVAVKKRLQLYYLKRRSFLELRPEINLPDTPLSLAFNQNIICIAYKSEYSMVQYSLLTLGVGPNDYEKTDLIQTLSIHSSVTLMADGRFALGKEDQTVRIKAITEDSEPGKQNSVGLGLKVVWSPEEMSWSQPPSQIVHDPPFVIAALPNCVEIRTEKPNMVIQTTELPKPNILSTDLNSSGLVYVASNSDIWCMKMTPVTEQIPQLIEDKQFELALTLTQTRYSSDDKFKRIQEIKIMCAFDSFVNCKFKEALKLFLELDVDATHVIGLYPDLLPSDFRSQLKYPEKPPILSGQDLEDGYFALRDYLTDVRHKLEGSTAKILTPLPMVEGITIKSKKQLMQIIDTTRVKCYLKLNDPLLGRFMNVKNNCCHQEETERVLKKSQKFTELKDLYKTRGLHQKALSLLQDQSEDENSPLFGTSKTVQYLLDLGPENIDLVCEYGAKVIEKSTEQGLDIFTDEIDGKEWPREKVHDFLLKNCKDIVIPYLEHIIYNWKEIQPIFHNDLILQYKDLLVELFEMAESQDSQDKISETRTKLRKLLENSKFYSADTILPRFPTHCLFEERALLLGSLGKHKDALVLLLFQVCNFQEALEYCAKQNQTKNVYNIIYQLLISPPDAQSLQRMYVTHINAHANHQPDIRRALQVLEYHGTKVDLKVVLDSTPPSVPLSLFTPYLESTLSGRVSQRHQMQLLRNLMKTETLRVQEQQLFLESQKVTLKDDDVCPACSQKFRGEEYSVRFPNGSVMHYVCAHQSN